MKESRQAATDRQIKVTKSRLEQKAREGERTLKPVQSPNPFTIKHKGFTEWNPHFPMQKPLSTCSWARLGLHSFLDIWPLACAFSLELRTAEEQVSIWVGCLAKMWRTYGSFIRAHWGPIWEGMQKLKALPALCWAVVLWSPVLSQAVKSEDLELRQGQTQIQNKASAVSPHFTIVSVGHVDTMTGHCHLHNLNTTIFLSLFWR